jgi:hypothetical protein
MSNKIMKIIGFVFFLIATTVRAEEVIPYLQTPTSTSIYVCWQTLSDTTAAVQFGPTTSMGRLQQGHWQKLGDKIFWHAVKLEGLTPNSTYYYQIKTSLVESSVSHFQTIPAPGDRNGHIRFGLRSDNQTNYLMGIKVFDALVAKMKQLYGNDLASQIDLIFTTGDIVGTGSDLPSFRTEYFLPLYPLSPAVPSMTVIGNHEAENPNYYNYMKYDDFAGPQGEAYYKFQLGRILFIGLNSNSGWQNDRQITWLAETLDAASNDATIDWVFTFCHHPGHSSIWMPGNTTYVQDRVIPLLARCDKAELLAYGHSHDYERGAHPEATLRTMCVGGAAGALDRWSHNLWFDYPEIQRSFDHHHFIIVDVDLANRSYTIQTWSLGTPDKWLNSVKIDSFTRKLDATIEPQPPMISAGADSVDLPAVLQASAFVGEDPFQASQFQLTATSGDYSQPLVDVYRDFEHYFLDTGTPNWEPIDQNRGVDLTKYEITSDHLSWPGKYFWRVRYRDQNLLWSEWSEEAAFIVRDTGYQPDLAYNKALEFDGRESYVEMTDDLSQARLPVRLITVETWIKLNRHSTWGGYIGAVEDNGGYEKGWVLGNHDRKFSFALASTGKNDGDGFMTYLEAPSDFVYEEWYHVAATYNGAAMRLYVNGRFASSTAEQFGDILYDPNSFFDIGIYHDDNEFFVLDGQLDDIRLWDTVLSEATLQEWMHKELNASHPNYANLLSYWDLNEMDGNLVTDKQGNHHGQVLNLGAKNHLASTAPVGLDGILVTTKQEASAGPSGGQIALTITSTPGTANFIGIYQGGNLTSAPVDFEVFPDDVFYRTNIFWGAKEFGTVTANVTLNYAGVQQIDRCTNLRLLIRLDARSEWTDITDDARHDCTTQSFSLDKLSEFGEYSIGWENPLTKIETELPPPGHFILYENFPNPFNPSTTIRFNLAHRTEVALKIYDVTGRAIRNLIRTSKMSAGMHEVSWDGATDSGKPVASGIYFCRISTPEFGQTIKMMLIH